VGDCLVDKQTDTGFWFKQDEAEAYQVPDIPDAPGGLRIGTLLKLSSGDWLAIGYGQTFMGEGSYGFTGKGFVVVRAPDIEGRTWEVQFDRAELPWPRDAADPYCQWPPGGESVVRVLDRDTAVVITDTGLMPSCKPMPPEHALTREIHGRVQVRFLRRGSG